MSKRVILLLVVFASVASDLEAANLVYQILPTTLSNEMGESYELSGSITTDGTIGLLATGNNELQDVAAIVDFDIEVSGPTSIVFKQSNSDTIGFLGFEYGRFEATHSELVLSNHGFAFEWSDLIVRNNTHSLRWFATADIIAGGGPWSSIFLLDSDETRSIAELNPLSNSASLIIARVPEPSTLCGGLIAALAGCGYWVKRSLG